MCVRRENERGRQRGRKRERRRRTCATPETGTTGGTVGKAVGNYNAEVQFPSVTAVGKEPDCEIFAPVSDVSVYRRTAPRKTFTLFLTVTLLLHLLH